MYTFNDLTKAQELNSMGVYKITCTINNKVYVGATIQSFWRRLGKHISTLKRGAHFNPDLQKDFDQYGLTAFTFEVLEVVLDKTQIRILEYSYIQSLKSEYNVYTKPAPLPSYNCDMANGKITEAGRKAIQIASRSRPLYSTNTSGLKGVNWSKKGNKWFAQITVNNKVIHLGSFLTKEDAYKARLDAESKYFV